MYDIILTLVATNTLIFGLEPIVKTPTGIPLTVVFFGLLYLWQALPEEMYQFGFFQPGRFIALLVSQDAVQYVLHRAEHALHLRSHAVHHAHRNPRARDAFDAGVVDAFVQLLFPLFVVLHAVRPSRCTAVVFASLYALWLQFIHSDHPRAQCLRSRVWVVPAYHHLHHRRPNCNFSHVFVAFDWVGGTLAAA